MKLPFSITHLLCLVFISFGFSQCSSSKNAMQIAETIQVTDSTTPKAYYQHWIAGVRGGGSGTNVFINKSLLHGKAVDSIFFQKKVSKLNKPSGQSDFYTANFRGTLNQLKVQEIDTDDNLENIELSKPKEKEFSFELENDEAVVSYTEGNIIKYLKLTNMQEKEKLAYPSAPRHSNK